MTESAIYLVSYDLTEPYGNRYQVLQDYLTSLGAVRVLESTWMLRSQQSETALRDAIWELMVPRDRLIVASIDAYATTHARTRNLPTW